MNYENSKIYKIIGNVPNEPCYVGSTTKKYLSQRMTKHVGCYKEWLKSLRQNNKKIMSFELFDKYGIENCKIILLEAVNVNSKDELRQKEQDYIDKLECINKNRAYCTPEQRIAKEKLYREEKKEVIQQVKKDLYLRNKDIICAKMNEYRQANIDIIREKKKQYALNQGKATILAQRAKTYYCTSCDCELRLCKRPRHESTIKHITNTINYMKSFIDKYTEQIKNESNIIRHFSLE